MHRRFDHKTIEEKWQKTWLESGIYETDSRDENKEKEYVLVELPYPSGNLHIGHWYAFGVPDIYVRYQRMTGKQVIYPMGFDAFGLPAENAAIKRDINPREWTESNIEYMKGQLQSMGNAFSWNQTASTIDPDYYRWTQWMFTKFFTENIAYRGEGKVNWCPTDNTVIANEQVLADDTCERCGDTIEKRVMPQWMLRITDYADALIDDLDALDWPEHIKDAQRTWIGRSEGAEIDFTLSTGDQVTVFTTRPDTLYGATYMVLAPEHDLVAQITTDAQKEAVAAYLEYTNSRSERERISEVKEVTGAFTGAYATNPISGEKLPVWIGEYVLKDYGTGAIMAVPSDDERDFNFAKKYDLTITQVVDQYEYTNSGGGFFYNLSNLLFQNNILLFLLSYFTYLYLFEIFRLNTLNLILFLCLIFSHPQLTLWQANFSPTILFLLLLLFKGVINKNNLILKTLIISYLYFSIYLVSNIIIRNILI